MFSIVLGAENLSYVKSIETHARTFLTLNILSIGTVLAVRNLKLHKFRHSNIYPVKSILRVTSFVPRTVARSRSQPWFVFVFLEHRLPKGGLISKSFSLWLKSSKKVPNHSLEHLFFIAKCSGDDLAPIFGYLSQMCVSCHLGRSSNFEIGINY